jgi:hypothetical protein
MRDLYQQPWVEDQVRQTMALWHSCAAQPMPAGQTFPPSDRLRREAAYDEALQAVESELGSARQSPSSKLATQARITTVFARFSALALGLDESAIQILTEEFLPVGTALAQWARRYDPNLSMASIIQACRNAWTACGLQPLLGEPVHITPSILGYSLLYPYSDNYLDRADITSQTKLHFSRRFRDRLHGHALATQDSREEALWTMVALIEDQYPRDRYPEVYNCLLAIHQAQEDSIAQIKASASSPDTELLRLSCAKGGTSVLADACLGRGSLTGQESQFAFEWGVLLQLGDDLQDIAEDLERGSITLFSRAAAEGRQLDSLVLQLLNFSERVGSRMESLPHGTPTLHHLLRVSWRSLILGAVAESHQFFSPHFLEEAEQSSHFGFAFLRSRRERLATSQGLYAGLFEAFLEVPNQQSSPPGNGHLPPPHPPVMEATA